MLLPTPFLLLALTTPTPQKRAEQQPPPPTQCHFNLKLWQLCHYNGTTYHVQTFADFCNLTSSTSAAIPGIRGDGAFGPANVYAVGDDGKNIGEIFGGDAFFMDWKYYEYNGTGEGGKGRVYDKMTYAYLPPGGREEEKRYYDDEMEECERGPWSEDDEDVGKWEGRCTEGGKSFFLHSRTRSAKCSFECPIPATGNAAP